VGAPTLLQQLIMDRLAQTGRTPTSVAREGGLPASTVHSLLKRSKATPTMATLRKLAVGLDMPFDQLAVAAGYLVQPADGSVQNELEALMRIWFRLDPDAKRRLLWLAHSYLPRDEASAP
jgi:transcriptional regulator with XRE-family HTH domain